MTQTEFDSGAPKRPSAMWAPLSVAETAALGVVAVGLIAIAGGWFGGPVLRTGRNWAWSLSMSSGLMFLLLGVALHSKLPRGAPGVWPRVYRVGGQVAALLVLFAAALTLVEIVLGGSGVLKHPLLRGWQAMAHQLTPGGKTFPAPLNAFCLSLVAAGLDVRLGRVWISQVLAVVGLLVAFLALVGYGCGVPEFCGKGTAAASLGMPLVDVLGFLLLGGGLLCVRPERGLMVLLWSCTPGGMLARRLMLAPVAGLLLTGVVYLALTRGHPVNAALRTWTLGLSNLLFVTVPIWAAAHGLHLAGLERDHMHRVLETRVQERTAELSETNAALQEAIRGHHQTEQALREARDRLRVQAAELEQRVAERTAQLEETLGDLESFSYSVAHDMRAPLRGMQGFARLLLEEHAAALNPVGRDYLERIAAAASRMDQLIQDALSYTQTLRAETPLKPVDLGPLIRKIIANVPQWQPPHAEVRVEGELPSVIGNQGLLEQCVTHLVANAVKFVNPGTTPQVRIWAESLAASVRLWVEDNGIGITVKEPARIFRMFERLHRTDEYEGTGIGLAVVRKAVERMAGQIGYESEPGKGTRFWIELKRELHT